MITAAHLQKISTSACGDILQIKIELTNQKYWIINLPLPVAILLFNNSLPYAHTYIYTQVTTFSMTVCSRVLRMGLSAGQQINQDTISHETHYLKWP